MPALDGASRRRLFSRPPGPRTGHRSTRRLTVTGRKPQFRPPARHDGLARSALGHCITLPPASTSFSRDRTSGPQTLQRSAADRTAAAPHDDQDFAGDGSYAPPELLYGAVPTEWAMRRLGCDAYLLGSLLFFFFAGTGMTAALVTFLSPAHHPRYWGDGYPAVLPHVRAAFESALTQFRAAVTRLHLPWPTTWWKCCVSFASRIPRSVGIRKAVPISSFSSISNVTLRS